MFEPLGIRDIVADPAGLALERVAHLADTSHPGTDIETYNSAYWRGLALPWGGLFGTPRDAVRFAAAFLPSGERFLSEAATSLMTTDQTMGVPGGVESAKVRWDPGRWGLGWEVKGEKRRHWTGDFTSPRTFCHFGHAGTLLWGDPERDLALAVFANRTVTHMWGFILAALGAAEQRGRSRRQLNLLPVDSRTGRGYRSPTQMAMIMRLRSLESSVFRAARSRG